MQVTDSLGLNNLLVITAGELSVHSYCIDEVLSFSPFSFSLCDPLSFASKTECVKLDDAHRSCAARE